MPAIVPKSRRKAPSRAVTTGTGLGATLAPALIWAAQTYAPGVPMPVIGSLIAAATGAFAYFSRGGRKDEPQ